MKKIKSQIYTLLIATVILIIWLWLTIELIVLVVLEVLKQIWRQYVSEFKKTEAKIKASIKY